MSSIQRKNNVFIDVIALGELEQNEPKLRELVDAANGNAEERNCHLVTIPAGVLPSDILISSPILRGDGATGGGGGGDVGGGDAFADFGGVDPNMDPELAMALRVSMEEERARQERAAAAAGESKEGEGMDTAESQNAEEMTDEDALLQQALAMSMAENEAGGEEAGDAVMDTGDNDDAAMQMA